MTARGPTNRLWSTLRVLRRPREALDHWIERYGDPVLVPTVNGTTAMTADPALAKAMFAHDPRDYEAFGANALGPLLGEGSLLVISGDRHRQERKLIMPPFHGARMRAYADQMRYAARRHFARAAHGRTILIQEIAQAISIDVIVRTVFGITDEHRIDEFGHELLGLTNSAGPLRVFIPALQRDFAGLNPFARGRRQWEAIDHTLQERIEETRERGLGDDILSLLVGATYEDGSAMADEHIRDELRTLLIAGHETTAIAMSWAIDAIHRNPSVLRRVRSEVDDAGEQPAAEDARLPYLDCVAKETLRHYPVAPEVMRVLRNPMTFGGQTIPAGHGIGVSIINLHHRPDLYEDPDAFVPERFETRKYGPHEYLPFGGGHRRCIGAAFAGFELRVVLAAALREFEFELQQAESPRIVRRNITMEPKGGIPARVGFRKGAVPLAA